MAFLNQIEERIKLKCSHIERNRIRDTEFIVGRTSATNDIDIYLVLDSLEGKECVGHWLWECSIYVQFFKELQTIYPSIKILMNGYKRYKEQFCELLGVDKKYLEYTYLLYLHLKNTVLHNSYRKLFTEMNSMFPFTPIIEKTVPIIYMRRSLDTNENYKNGTNRRKFNNLDTVIKFIQNKEIPIYDVKDFSNLKEQIEVVEKAKVIIVEHGSAWYINGILFSRGTHIIILNKLGIGCIDLEDELCKENGNTYEFIESSSGPNNIIINIQELNNAIERRNL